MLEKLPSAILFDLDGTLADIDARRDKALKPNGKLDWDIFAAPDSIMNWDKPILTDSGGFQIMSLSKLNKIDDEIGATFRSHIDGKKIVLSPEKSIRIQKSINSDILMVLDECPKLTHSRDKLKTAIYSQGINLKEKVCGLSWHSSNKDIGKDLSLIHI